MNDELIQYLERVNNFSEFMWTIYIKLFLIPGLSVATTMPFVIILINHWLTGSFYSEKLYRPFKLV